MAILPLLCSLFTTIQQHLFPFQEEPRGELSDKHKALIELTGLAGVEKFMPPFKGDPIGRPRHKRQPIVVVFPAKAVWNDSTIRALLDRLSADSKLRPLCGWETELDLPGEASGTRSLPGGRKVAILSEKRTMRCL